MTKSIQISLSRGDLLVQPNRDLVIGRNVLRVGVTDLVGATQYCFRISQTGYSSGELCYADTGVTFAKTDPIWDSLSPGPLTVRASVYSGGMLLGSDSTTINLS